MIYSGQDTFCLRESIWCKGEDCGRLRWQTAYCMQISLLGKICFKKKYCHFCMIRVHCTQAFRIPCCDELVDFYHLILQDCLKLLAEFITLAGISASLSRFKWVSKSYHRSSNIWASNGCSRNAQCYYSRSANVVADLKRQEDMLILSWTSRPCRVCFANTAKMWRHEFDLGHTYFDEHYHVCWQAWTICARHFTDLYKIYH